MACTAQGWQLSRFRHYGAAIFLVLLAALLARPTLHLFAAPAVQQGPPALRARVQQVMTSAQRDDRPYSILLCLNSSEIRVVRWVVAPGSQQAQPEPLPKLSAPFPNGITVESTTIDGEELIISERGSLLSVGRIVLKAPDGSRATVEVGADAY
ncbi:MAG TPA: hypothetical protein VGL77_19245 [Armatimonadota bacterium]|jgi:hypothetical protein